MDTTNEEIYFGSLASIITKIEDLAKAEQDFSKEARKRVKIMLMTYPHSTSLASEYADQLIDQVFSWYYRSRNYLQELPDTYNISTEDGLRECIKASRLETCGNINTYHDLIFACSHEGQCNSDPKFLRTLERYRTSPVDDQIYDCWLGYYLR